MTWPWWIWRSGIRRVSGACGFDRGRVFGEAIFGVCGRGGFDRGGSVAVVVPVDLVVANCLAEADSGGCN